MSTAAQSGNLSLKLIAAAVASCFSGAALASPTGPSVAAGSVSFNSSIPGQLQITNSPGSIINWQGFSISAGELTQFMQQSAQSAVLNRVVTTGPGYASSILGTLSSNGRVFLINPNGIVFGAGSVVDTAGLVASTLNLTDADFASGRMRFQPVPGAGSVENYGNISTPSGGQVYLVGPAVTNGGVITSPQGEVVLAAGNSVELMSSGTPGVSVTIDAPDNHAVNLGQILADQGHIGIFGGVINQGGTVSANSAVLGSDGSIKLVATHGAAFDAGSNTTGGTLSVDAGDVTVAGNVYTGPQTIHASGGVNVQDGQLSATGGQDIQARYLQVESTGGGFAGVLNSGGEQHIVTSGMNGAGEGLAVRTTGGGFATVSSSGGAQSIEIHDADRAVVEGLGGFANINGFGGSQSISITGSGANALVLGDPAANHQSLIGADVQSVVAGMPGERGSITVYGPADSATGGAMIVTSQVPGGTQSVSTSGALSIIGGSAPTNPQATGIFANGIAGQQTVTADSILLKGGPTGFSNVAAIAAGSGSQLVQAGAGGITLLGGGGVNSYAQITQNSSDSGATQNVVSAGQLWLEGGSGTNDYAMIRGAGGHQGIQAGDTTLLAGAGGTDNFSSIQAPNQDIVVAGNLALIARGSAGTPAIGGGVRIGGLGGPSASPTALRLDVAGDFSMTGGGLSGALLGNAANLSASTDIDLRAGGNVTLSGGTGPGTYSTIGSRATNLAGGNISVTAGGDIALNSTAPDQASVIRTTDGVSLTARQIAQGADSRIEAGSLYTNTQQGAALAGNNAVDAFNAFNAGYGDVTLNNTSPTLTMTSLQNVGSGLSLWQNGGLVVDGIVNSGSQTIHADSILVQAGSGGSNLSAQLTATSGSQWIDVGAGGLTLRGGLDGSNNFAAINQGSSNTFATQTITSAGPVWLEGGSGTGNDVFIRSGGGHQQLTLGETTLLGGVAGIDNYAAIMGRTQDISIHGNLSVAGRGSAGSPNIGGGARIGGLGGATATPTALALSVDGDFTMSGGTASGALIGNGTGVTADTNIAISALGDVSLNGGTGPNTYSTIGSRATNVAGGSISIYAGDTIALNSTAPDQASIIRTTDDVSLMARQITQGAESTIVAGSLALQTADGASLLGANSVGLLNASNWNSGGLAFNNAAPVLTVASAINPVGNLSLTQTGDLHVTGSVSSGPQSIDVGGGLIVENIADPAMLYTSAQLGASGGQAIRAGYVEVHGQAGGSASIFNFGGAQHIVTMSKNAAGEGLAVRATDNGFASIDSPLGPQTIEVQGADRMAVDGESGMALVNAIGNAQSISLTGSGANALVLGSPTATYQSQLAAGSQDIVAGNPGDQGSITLYGTAGGGIGTAVISTANMAGGTQSVRTSGALSVLGATAPSGLPTGIFAADAGGQQTVAADSILIRGGSGGSNNGAQIGANAGTQSISAGTLTLTGGSGGTNNGALLRTGGGAQTIVADQLTVNAGASGVDNRAVIVAPQQEVTVSGDVTLNGGGSSGSPTPTGGGGALIGGGASFPTNLNLKVGGNVTLNGGSVSGSAIGAGGAAAAQPTHVVMNVGGDVTLNPGMVIGSRIGTMPTNLAGGDIEVNAGGTIALNSAGPGNAGAIRTADRVTLRARQISEGPDAAVQANTLRVESKDGASLAGANTANSFSASNSSSGDVAFNNTAPLLTVTGIDQVSGGALALQQSGNLLVNGDVTSGPQAIAATGDTTITPGAGSNVTVEAHGAQTFSVGGSFSLLGGTALGGYAQTLASGPVSITTGGDLAVRGGDGLLAYALLYGGDGIHLTVGNELHVDGGRGLLAFARVQTDLFDRIWLAFPNRGSGGYFVDGREGAVTRGLDGFYTSLLPARPGRSLIVKYGL